MMRAMTGQCLCGAVRVRGTLPGTGFNACHCVQCQRWTGGGPYMAILVDDLVVEGEENLTAYRASTWGERVNCRTCGATIYWRMQGRPPRMVALGLLDDQSGLHLTSEIFVDHRPDWLPQTPGATQTTEAQELAELEEWLAREKP